MRPSAVGAGVPEHVLRAFQFLQRDRRRRIGYDGFLKFADGFLEFPVGAALLPPFHMHRSGLEADSLQPDQVPGIARVLIHGLHVELQRQVPVFPDFGRLGLFQESVAFAGPGLPGQPHQKGQADCRDYS